MATLERDGKFTRGILSVIVGGNYSSFRQQRSLLRQVHLKAIGPVDAVSH
jgi:hypothetical protein